MLDGRRRPAAGPAADSRPYTLANILLVILVLKTPIEVYNYILFLIYKYLRAMKWPSQASDR